MEGRTTLHIRPAAKTTKKNLNLRPFPSGCVTPRVSLCAAFGEDCVARFRTDTVGPVQYTNPQAMSRTDRVTGLFQLVQKTSQQASRNRDRRYNHKGVSPESIADGA